MIYEHQIISTLECGHRLTTASNVLTPIPSIMKTLDWINWQMCLIENERGLNTTRENEAIAGLLDSDKKWFMWLQFVSGPVLFPVFTRAISQTSNLLPSDLNCERKASSSSGRDIAKYYIRHKLCLDNQILREKTNFKLLPSQAWVLLLLLLTICETVSSLNQLAPSVA